MIYSLVVPVGRCSERNPQGVATQGHYVVENGQVILTDAEGNRTSRRATLKAGDDHRTIAARLILHRWQDERRSSNTQNGFGRGEVLEYDRWKY
jgi:hypothetical protein